MLDEYERDQNVTRQTERYTVNNMALISPQDLADLKEKLVDKTKKAKEFEQLLNEQNAKYEMELKKSNLLMTEIKKLRE